MNLSITLNEANSVSIDTLADILRQHRKLYYDGKPKISDDEFDKLEKILKKRDKNNKYFSEVGSVPETKNTNQKFKHSVPMLSVNSVKNISDLVRWSSSIGISSKSALVAEPKIDGIACALYYDSKGKYVVGVTRGNGKVGFKLPNVKYLKSVPTSIPWPYNVPFSIRGELYIPKKEKDNLEKANSLRNYVYGVVRRNTKTAELDLVNFRAFQFISEEQQLDWFPTEESVLKFLNKNFPKVVPYELCSVGDNSLPSPEDVFQRYIESYRDDWEYETDGLVFTVNERSAHKDIDGQSRNENHHLYNIAFKPPAEIGYTTLIDIDWEVSQHGKLIPVGRLDPVRIGPVQISSVNLIHAQNIVDSDIRNGAILVIERANDVIPKMVSMTNEPNRHRIKLPTSCPSCGTNLRWEGINLCCDNKKCKQRITNHIYSWVKSCDMKHVGKRVIEQLCESDAIDKIADLYTKKLSDILSVIPGYSFDGARISKILLAIDQSRTMSEQEMIANFGIPNVAMKTLQNNNIATIDDLEGLKYVEPQSKTIANIKEWVSDKKNIKELKNLKSVLNIKNLKKLPSKNSEVGVCITGRFDIARSDMENILEKAGFTVHPSVQSDTKILIASDKQTASSKYKKAKKMGIQIMNDITELVSDMS